ncbi:MAG: nuclear transport factor 2 family protein, partial [Deltaproteobacteria bacterium]
MLLRTPYLSMLLALAPGVSACLTGTIPNTDVADNSENREVIGVAERYRRAVEQRDVRTLLSLAAPNYFEDGGTPQGDDDYGYDGLRRLLAVWTEEVREVRYEMRYRRVTFERDGNRAQVDYTYTGSFTLRRPQMANQTNV